MKQTYDSVLDLIGNTPLVKLGLAAGFKSQVYVKMEMLNPGGSVKDRIGRSIIDQAEAKGEIQPGGTIIEATSGNTGLGLAMVAQQRGYKCIFVMPDKQSQEKVRVLRAYGAKVVVTPTAVEPEDPRSYYSVARRLVEETPNSFYANQYHNPDNPRAHYESTGPELWEQTEGKIDVFIGGMGTGGTLSGTGRFLKEKNPEVKIVGVDPVGSVYYDLFKTGHMPQAYTYKVEGIGEDFLPSTMNMSVLDDVVRVNDRECFVVARQLVRREGIFTGGSGGAAVAGALRWLKHNDKEGQTVVILLPDSGARYLSKLYNDEWMAREGYLNAARDATVADLLAAKERDVFTIRDNATVSDGIALMKKHDISHVPALDAAGKVCGVLSESRALREVLGGVGLASPVSEIMDKSFCIIDLQTDFTTLLDLLSRARIALVMEEDRLINVLNRLDLIDHLSPGQAEGRS